ncbi:MAG: TIGR04219 family outer membrane beta-barrel protein [Gammaproteobacteria bacterium]|nr:TIGR04219 family outer membrane beta-barrel protein [Gammaproteobacteria bacterium]MDH3536680.1 TIGR04219 family outer membrane beta-barrel protein [Gammaproteobacteria bacterium]
MRATWIVPALSACLALTTGAANADFVGLNIGASQWKHGFTDAYDYQDSSKIDLVDDLDIENPEQKSMVLILEHPIKALPNIRYQAHDLDSSGFSTMGSDSSFSGRSLNSGNEVTSTVDLSQNDIVLYYQLLKNRINLDLGVDLKRFDGEVSFDGTTSTIVAVDETIPLLYLSARYDLPKSGFYVGASINANFINLGLSESSAQDSTIMLGYESGNGLGVEGGYKSFSLELDNANNLATDLEYDGLYLNGYFNF